MWLFVRVLGVSSAADFAAAAFVLVVLVGLHTFRGTVQEAFPINHFLEIVVLCLVTLNLGASPDTATWRRAWCMSDEFRVRELLDDIRPLDAAKDCEGLE